MDNDNFIFKLFRIEYDKDNHQYPKFDIFHTPMGCFSSRDEAEQVMNKYDDEYDYFQLHQLYGFVIEEHEVDESGESDEQSNDSMVNYLTYIPEKFSFIVDEKWDFENGDLVEALRENTVTLEIVVKEPVPPVKVGELDDGAEIYIDGDPCYTTLTTDGDRSRHIRPNLFPPRFPVSDELRVTLQRSI